jgi:L-ribulokinase
MSIVAGVDFGTLSVRVSIFDSERGRLGSGSGDYPLHRTPPQQASLQQTKPEQIRPDPNHATQSHKDQMAALEIAFAKALGSAQVAGAEVEALAIDATASSVIPVDARLEPLDDYYLWCDHRAWHEAAAITAAAHDAGLPAINWCGGTYSSEWGFSKLLHWLRHNPEKRSRFATALENCDMVTATLTGVSDAADIRRSICAMGHKWMWNPIWGGLPSEEFLVSVDPLLKGIRETIAGRYATSGEIAGHLTPEWAKRLGLRSGIPIPVGAIDAHWDAIGAGARLGDIVNVVGTSTCIMAMSPRTDLIPGVCGVVPGSIHPGLTGIEAGLSATGDIFDAIASRAGSTVADLSAGLETYRAGSTGLLRLNWDNGDRTVLVNPELSGVTLGWRLTTTAQDELFAAIESSGFHTRIIIERMEEYGVPVERIINAGGIPQKNSTLNRVYAGILNKPVLVPERDVTSLGSAIFAFLAAGTFQTVEEAQAALSPGYKVVEPDPADAAVYARLYPLFRDLYFKLGAPDSPLSALHGIL